MKTMLTLKSSGVPAKGAQMDVQIQAVTRRASTPGIVLPNLLACLFLKLTQVFNNTTLASWFSGNASISAMQDQ